jgi:hypothetical protein
MKSMMAICGLDCGGCGAYLATVNDDDDKREEVAALWSKQYKAAITPEMINCRGCRSESEPLFSHCQVCEIRQCGQTRGVENCAHCDDFPCEKIGGFFKMAPEAQSNLENVHKTLTL